MERPTKKQHELLLFIDGFIKGNGYGPSYREVMRALDYKSVSTVAKHIDGLIARGWLIKKDNSARSLIVCMPGNNNTKGIAGNIDKSVEKTLKDKILELDNDDDKRAVERTLELLGLKEEQ